MFIGCPPFPALRSDTCSLRSGTRDVYKRQEDGTAFDLANPGGKEEKAQPAAPQTIQSSAAAYRDLNATPGNFYEQPKNDNAEMDELLERIGGPCGRPRR